MNLAGILAASTSTAVLVEGESDRAAVETLASRRGLPLAALGVQVVAMGGITNIGHHLVALGDQGGQRVRVGGLYDAAEERFVVKGLDRTGLRPFTATTPLSDVGFFRCDRDLEDELIRAIGVDGLLALVESEGELRRFELLQGQPAQRARTTMQQLHRFIGSKSGRKERYGRRLAQVVELDRVPVPLDALLRWAV